MAFTPKGKHFVAGEWLDGAGTFEFHQQVGLLIRLQSVQSIW